MISRSFDHKKPSSNTFERLCSNCGGFIAGSMDSDAGRFFSYDTLCHCGETMYDDKGF